MRVAGGRSWCFLEDWGGDARWRFGFVSEERRWRFGFVLGERRWRLRFVFGVGRWGLGGVALLAGQVVGPGGRVHPADAFVVLLEFPLGVELLAGGGGWA
jgi:hypothetical protein